MHSRRRTKRFVTLAICAGIACSAPASSRPSGAAAVFPDADTLTGVTWVRFALPTGGTLSAAVARPAVADPRPVLVILHGTHGFAREYVALARNLAQEAGAVVVAACWFAGRRGGGVDLVTPIECPEAPPMPSTGMATEALTAIDALIEGARSLPGVAADRVALLGHSRGAVAAVYYALEHANARGLHAVILNSGAYPPELVARAGELRIPALLLHGTADGPSEGGSEMTTAVRARAFEGALVGARKVVEAQYFDGARHAALFYDADQRRRSVVRITDFLRRHGFE